MIKKLIAYLFFLGIATSIFSQEVQLVANAPKVVEVGEQFQVQFTVNAQPSGFLVPEMKDFNLLMGPSTSSSSSMSWVNGKVTQSVSYNYTYIFQAVKPGKYLVGAAEATVGGKKYKSNSFTIEVIGSGSAQPNTQQQSQPQNQSSSNQEDVVTEGEIFLRLIIDKKNLYQGEYAHASVKIYTKLGISSAGRVSPAFNGFYVQELSIPQPRLEPEVVNGQKWHTAILNKFVLIPQKSGIIKLDPLQLEVIVQREIRGRQRGFFDDFFGSNIQESQIKIKTLPVTINVKPLPANKPESFAGAVGRFSFDAKLDKNKVKTNDAITLKLTLSGTGNIKLIEAPKIEFPTDFETYDPKINLNTAKSSGDISGIKTFEYLLIPRNPGDFKLNPIAFSYFDPATNQYKTITTDALDIAVEKGSESQRTAVVSGLSKEDVKFVGKDILFIKVGKIKLHKISSQFFGSTLFYLVYAIGILAFALVVIMWRRIIKQNANIAFVRNKRADKFASKRLKQARIHLQLNEKEKFYEELLKAIWGYLSDKLNIPLADLSRDNAREMLLNKGITPGELEKFIGLIDNCEFARYAPASSDTMMKDDYQTATDFITKLQSKLR